MTDLDEFKKRSDVHQETSESYDAWNTSENKNFKKGAYLVGVLVEKRTGVGSNNSNLYVIEKRGGEKISIWGSSVIDPRLQNKELGQEFAIVYMGKQRSEKTGREYHNYEFYFANYRGSTDLSVDEIDQAIKELK